MRIVVAPGLAQSRLMRTRAAIRKLMVATAAVVLAACGSTGVNESAAAASAARNNEFGKKAYEEYCAGCHETGMLGAPIAGDADFWEGRSTLWQAVLMEHAKTGYFDMPAKGSRPDLPDETIDAATEYMLSITFPDLPKDR